MKTTLANLDPEFPAAVAGEEENAGWGSVEGLFEGLEDDKRAVVHDSDAHHGAEMSRDQKRMIALRRILQEEVKLYTTEKMLQFNTVLAVSNPQKVGEELGDYKKRLKSLLEDSKKIKNSQHVIKVYWTSSYVQNRLPLHVALAHYFVTLPATSASIERVFSICRKIMEGKPNISVPTVLNQAIVYWHGMKKSEARPSA